VEKSGLEYFAPLFLKVEYMETLENKEFYEALDQYYKLKNNYETNFDKDKMKIIRDPSKSWKEKRIEFKKLKPKCINCRRPVGTRFTRTFNSDDQSTLLKAICGSLSEPCNLNIELKSSKTELYPEVIQGLEKDIQEDKLEIINNKNKLIFNYINSEEAVELFDKIKESIQDNSDILAYYLEEYLQIVDNQRKNTELKEEIEKSYLMMNDLKEIIKKYDETGHNPKLIQDVVGIYVNQLTPLLKEIQMKKYSKNTVDYNSADNTFHLIQEKVTIEDLSVRHSKAEVLHFDFGVAKKKTERNKKEFIEGELDLDFKDESKEEVLGLETLGEEDPTYQLIWRGLDETYKEYLQKEPEWLQETMEGYIKARKEGKFREFVIPSNLLYPPLVTEQGELDFGNNTFNEIIKTLPKMQQDILKNYKPKEPNNYTFLENQMKQILGQKFHLTKF